MPESLNDHQRSFLELFVTRQALRFGDFTLKSGRKSPYFVNSGCFCYGADLAPLGEAYAATIAKAFSDVDIVFGPAYKGVPLALATAQALERTLGRPIGWTYDRKEAKTHGDKGAFVGAPLTGNAKVVVVDDVITAGTALRESLTKLQAESVAVLGAVVSIDREEPGPKGIKATIEIAQEFGVPVTSILTISQAVDHLSSHDVAGQRYLSDEDAARVRAHLSNL